MALAAVGLALLLAATPQGRDAVSWAAELVDIGEVGGPPSNGDRPEAVTPASEQVVIANGRAPDGTRYEIVAYRTESPIASETDRGAPCIFVDFPTSGDGGSGSCGDEMLDAGRSLYVSMVSESGASTAPTNPIVSGYVARVVDQVEVRVSDSDTASPAELVRLDEATRQRLGIHHDVGFFFQFLPTQFDVRGLSAGREELEVTAYDAGGELVDREVRGAAGDAAAPPEALLDSCEELLAAGERHDLCRELLDSYR